MLRSLAESTLVAVARGRACETEAVALACAVLDAADSLDQVAAPSARAGSGTPPPIGATQRNASRRR